MNLERVRQLQAFLAETPDDPFLVYALGVEYISTEPALAQRYFEQLLAEHPSYTGTYYQLAGLYRAAGELEKAKDTYEKGIAVCKQVQNRHALNELQRAYEDLIDEWE